MDYKTAVAPVVEAVTRLLSPRTIYLYNQKLSLKGELTAFKLCIIAELEDKAEAERSVYRLVDSDIPFDILLYTPQEWQTLLGDDASFAAHISESGSVVYG